MKRSHMGCGAVMLPLLGLVLYFVLHGLPTEPLPEPTEPAPPGNQGGDSYPHLRWGNPSGATADPANKNNFLMKKKYYALSYNDSKGTPNWVSWRLAKEDLGNTKRPPALRFATDEELPEGFRKITHDDYSGSGFDRGHMCPAGDRSSDIEAMTATFMTDNIVPQSPNNNEKGWEQFEDHCRSLAKEGKELYVVSGPLGQGGEGKNGRSDLIGHGKVTVPARTWKVVLVLNQGGTVDANSRLMAVDVPNDQTIGEEWTPYVTTVADVEQKTGYKFFDRAAPNILEPLKKEKADGRRIP